MKIDELEKELGISFKDKELLKKCLTHKSYSFEKKINQSNERLEFLGDSIISAVISELLYMRFSNAHQGELSKMKAYLVSEQNLLRWAKDLNLSKYIFLGKGEEKNYGREKPSILVGCLEAIVGGIYLEGGFSLAKKFITKNLLKNQQLTKIEDPKSELQEIIQKKYQTLPTYEVVKISGPDHNRTFEIKIKLDKTTLGKGIGKTKKSAEQNAAREALKKLKQN